MSRSRPDRIDKSTADPAILRAYKTARNSRYADEVLPLIVLIARCSVFVVILAIFAFDLTGMLVFWLIVGSCSLAFSTIVVPMVLWTPPGKRWIAVAVIAATVAFAGLMSYVMTYVVY